MDIIADQNSREIDTDIAVEASRSYLDYAMSVIIGRAIPDARDGLKPVHRRIIYAMVNGGYTHDKPSRKSARIVGEVLGKYHPHGDSSVYGALVRMAQEFSMSVRLVDGQGNFGSIDADPPAAMRYTEARMTREAALLTADLTDETVNWLPNYDESEIEPAVLPVAFPHLLVNGSEGIAVALTTKIPPHNPREAILAAIAVLENPNVSVDELLKIIPGPDFPTGAQIIGRAGIRQAYATGTGSITLRAKHHLETTKKGRRSLVFTEIPYQVIKKNLIERIDELVKQKEIDEIASIRDESDKDGIRIVVDIRKDADEEVLLAKLHRHTNLQTTFSINLTAIDAKRPRLLTLYDALKVFVDFRIETVRKRTKQQLSKARDRIHTRSELLIALSNTDIVIDMIRRADTTAAAKEALLQAEFTIDAELADLISMADPRSNLSATKAMLTEIQADSILELKLHRLTGLERSNLADDAKATALNIKRFLSILDDRNELKGLVKQELLQAAEQLGTPRRTTIEEASLDYAIEDFIKREDMVVTFTHAGYVKRCALSAYKAQKRGGKGRNGMETKDDDFVVRALTTNTHAPILVFTADGRAFKIKVYQLPLGEPHGRGRPIVNVIPAISKGDRIAAILELPEDEASWQDLTAVFCTEQGQIRRNTLEDFREIRANGKIAMKLIDETGAKFDTLISVLLANSGHDILISTARGQAIRFPAEDVRIFKDRSSTGVRAIKLEEGDRVLSAMTLTHFELTSQEVEGYLKKSVRGADGDSEGEAAELSDERIAEISASEQWIMSVTENGYGKRTSSAAYRVQSRAGKGIQDRPAAAKAGKLIGTLLIEPADDIVLITDGGQTIRLPAAQVRVTRRNATGVKLISLKDGEKVVSVSPATKAEEQLDVEA